MKKTGKFRLGRRTVFGAIVATAFAMALATGCAASMTRHLEGDGAVESRERPAFGFDAVEHGGVGNVRVHPGEDFRVVVTADGNLQDFVGIAVRDGVLVIYEAAEDLRPLSLRATELTVDVYLPALRAVELRGTGNLTVGPGSAPYLSVSVSGAGNVCAGSFEAQEVEVALSGAGGARVFATGELYGNVSGIGDVVLFGGASNRVVASGPGKVTRG
ncbi:MAG: DUF2807 domain-containing protein [Treponema sp.]|nr:DUF2807 domain-containing protein [Treponema sp.]